jgi:hypothetical protein
MMMSLPGMPLRRTLEVDEERIRATQSLHLGGNPRLYMMSKM